jgi:hypothetical protein
MNRILTVGGYQAQRLVIVPAQFLATSVTAPTVGIMRRYSDFNFVVYTTPITQTDFTAPSLWSVDAQATGNTLTFSALLDDGQTGVHRTRVLYRSLASTSWSGLDLTYNAATGVASGVAPLPAGSYEYFVQAVDNAGNVAVAMDHGVPFRKLSATADFDGDGVADASDTCLLVPNGGQADADHDGLGDACDLDADNDGSANPFDAFPTSAAESADTDRDGIGDNADPDIDNDGIPNAADNCRYVANAGQLDSDGDAAGNACDEDDDNDGVPDGSDAFPIDATRRSDLDRDGVDDDGADADNCPFVANPGQADSDHDGIGDACDNRLPETALTAAPSGLTASASAALSFGGSDAETPAADLRFECQLDGGAWATCASPLVQSGLADGAHSFAVRAVDASDERDPSPATASWTVDTTAPNTTISAGPDALTNRTSASFSFSGNDGAGSGVHGFVCSLDGATPTPCSSPAAYSGLASDGHSFEVRAVDAAGNADPNPATSLWVVDTTEPDTLVDAQPAALVNTAAASILFSSTKAGSSFACKLDGEAWALCTSPLALSSLADGPHSLLIQATDRIGNSDSTPALVSWAVDTGPESVTIGAVPALTNRADMSISFSSTKAGSSFACQLDGEVYATCSSPLALSGLADGPHTLAVRPTDSFGVAWPASSVSWAVDTAAPETTIDAAPAALTNQAGAIFVVGSEAGSKLECQLDGGAWAECAGTAAYSGLADGSHRFAARATDAAGNTDSTPASYGWTIDLTPPTTSLTSSPAGATSSRSASFSFSSSETGSSFQCALDGGAYVDCTSPQTYGGLAEGTHRFAVRATDAAGNTDPSTISYSWLIDLTPGDTSIVGGPKALSNSTTASFVVSSSKPGSSFQCQLDTADWAACGSAPIFSGLAQGSHRLAVRAVDAVGNVDPTPASYSWTVDSVAPETSIAGGPDNPTTSTTATFVVASSEAGSSFACKLDTGPWGVCTTYSGLALGTHTLQARATDAAGNTDNTPASYSWTIRQAYPFTGFFSPVKNLPVVNVVKAGSVIPVRFSLGANYGKDIFAPGYPLAQPVACPARSSSKGDDEDEIDEVESPGFETLIYAQGNKRYTYLWKTDRAWAGTCQQLVVKFNDGSPARVATFKFVR